MKIFDSTLKTLERSLDIRLVEQNVLAGNVANADTPGADPAGAFARDVRPSMLSMPDVSMLRMVSTLTLLPHALSQPLLSARCRAPFAPWS